MITTTTHSPPRRMSTPTSDPAVWCRCGREYRPMRRRSTLIGYRLAGTTAILAGAPVCSCGRKVRASELVADKPFHPCPSCYADLGLEEFAEAAARNGYCHNCAATCPRCRRTENRRTIEAAGGVCPDCEPTHCPRCGAAPTFAAERPLMARTGQCGQCHLAETEAHGR